MTIKLQYTLYNGKKYESPPCILNLGRPLIASSGLWNSSLQDIVEDGPEEEMAAAGGGHFNMVHHPDGRQYMIPEVYDQPPFHAEQKFSHVTPIHPHIPQYNQMGTLNDPGMPGQRVGFASASRICHPVQEDQPDRLHQAFPHQQHPGYYN